MVGQPLIMVFGLIAPASMGIKAMKRKKKIVVFDEVYKNFVCHIETVPINNQTIFINKLGSAYDFGSLSAARSWADSSGFDNLVVLIVAS